MILAALVVAAVGLSACSEVRRTLGYEKQPPDEFQVVQRAPLSLPPDFGLRPPTPGAVRPQEGSPRDQARRVLTGNRGSAPLASDGRSTGDIAFAKRIGADQIQPDIRATVNKETQALAETEKSFSDRLVFWRKAEPSGVAVDPVKESQRLRENQALGRPVSDGETPKIERRKKAILEGVVGDLFN
jgi:hypothetical protein